MDRKTAGPVNPVPDELEIAPGVTRRVWCALNLSDESSPDWETAIRIFTHRINSRFIEPANVLIEHERSKERGTFGFSILAIDCLVIEALEGFREGLPSHNGKSKDLVKAALKREPFAKWFPGADDPEHFYKGYRCALHHSGQTDGDLRIRRSGEVVERDPGSGTMWVNRTKMHDLVKEALARYVWELRDSQSATLRQNFVKKMNAICGIKSA